MTERDHITKAVDEVDHFLHGDEAHRLGHYWFDRGCRDLATTYFRVAAMHGVAAADEDLAVLRASTNARTAGCSDEDWRPAPPPPAWRRAFPRLAWPVPAAVTAALAAGVYLLAGGSPVPPTAPAPMPSVLAQQDIRVPTALPSRSAGPQLRLDLSRHSTSTAVPPEPPAAEDPEPSKASTGPVDGPHIEVSRKDGNLDEFTALVATDKLGGWRRLQLGTVPGERFRATLWSAGQYPCTWRFTGAGDNAAEPTSQVVEVAAGERQDTTLDTREWPMLRIEVRGGDRSDSCLLVNRRFVPVESAPQESSPAPTPSSPTVSTPATAAPSAYPDKGRR